MLIKMKIKYLYTLLTLLLIIWFFVFKNDAKSFKIDDIKYAISVNGNQENRFPAKGPYQVLISCEGADGVWNYQKWVGEISDITGSVSCDFEFTSTTKTTMADYIKNLLGTKTSVSACTRKDENGNSIDDGSKLEKINNTLDTGATATDYRYRGIDPNNYILFNDELWRIIGVLDEYSHGQKGQQLVKIIRNDTLGVYVYDKSNKNNWPNSSIYSILNDAYYNSVNRTGADYCYLSSTLEPAKCNFTGSGIKNEYRNMIKNVTWYLGGYSGTALTSSDIYKYERSTNTSSTYYYSDNFKKSENTPIGLMYVSDYGYASTSSCTNNLENYNVIGCSDKNWLKKNYSEWTITHDPAGYSNIFSITRLGSMTIDFSVATESFSVRPTLYLDSSVYYISGDGSQTNPYIIAM